jgi:four helix bundle protein
VTKTFEDFPVYKKGLNLAKEINSLCGRVKGSQTSFLKDQIKRALASVLLNIAEGSVKWNKKDKMNFYRIGEASACECIAALDLFHAYQLVDYKCVQDFKRQLNEIVRDLHALVISINKRIK